MAIESTAKHIIPGSPLSTVLSENKGNPITVNTTAGSSVSGQFTDYTASHYKLINSLVYSLILRFSTIDLLRVGEVM